MRAADPYDKSLEARVEALEKELNIMEGDSKGKNVQNDSTEVPTFLRAAGKQVQELMISGDLQAPTGPDNTKSITEDYRSIATGITRRTITVDSRRGSFTYRRGQDLHIKGPDNHLLKITEVYPGDKATVFYYIRDGQQTVGRIVVLVSRKPTRK